MSGLGPVTAAGAERTLAEAARTALVRASEYLAGRQASDGSWPCDYTGPTFLLPLYVALCHLADQPIPTDRAAKMRTHLMRGINEDGGIGLYVGGPGVVFTSCLGYVALRLLGAQPSDPALARLRGWIHAHGSPLASAHWGKIVLATLGLYEYDGLAPVPPELWLLPYRLPIHPGRLWCHARQVYLPMSWLYGTRSAARVTGLIRQLRDELYDVPYHSIRWRRYLFRTDAADTYRRLTIEYRAAMWVLRAVSRVLPARTRRRALDEVMTHIRYEVLSDRTHRHRPGQRSTQRLGASFPPTAG